MMLIEKTDPNSLPANACLGLRITYSDEQGTIILEHLDENEKVLSECHFSPDEAYDYAKLVMSVYDEVEGIT